MALSIIYSLTAMDSCAHLRAKSRRWKRRLLDIPKEGCLRLVRRPEGGLLDVDSLASISICGVEIPLT